MAALAWAAAFGTLGYLLGDSVERLLGEIERWERPVALALLAVTVLWIGWRQTRHWRQTSRIRARALSGQGTLRGRDLGMVGALSVGIGGIVGGGIFATIGLAARPRRRVRPGCRSWSAACSPCSRPMPMSG